jgi:hypothetical protein
MLNYYYRCCGQCPHECTTLQPRGRGRREWGCNGCSVLRMAEYDLFDGIFSRANGELSYLITSDGNLYRPHICDLTAPVVITDPQLAVGHLYSLPECNAIVSMEPATSHRTRRCSCPEPDRREEPQIYLRLIRVQLAKGRRQVDQANAVTSAGSPEHLPRVVEVGTGVPRQEQPPTPSNLGISANSNGLSLVTNRNISIIF